MNKIKTIFNRDWDDTKMVVPTYTDGVDIEKLKTGIATEKLDGMNVRITVRSHSVVRVEKRRNPTKIQKAQGIVEPWYVDADEFSPEDKYIYEAVKNTDFTNIPDGEWSGECVGKNVQGNPLNLENNVIVFFSLGQAPVFENVPIDYKGLKEWLPKQKSKFGNECGIEGIVWHCGDVMYKIKTKDFSTDNRK